MSKDNSVNARLASVNSVIFNLHVGFTGPLNHNEDLLEQYLHVVSLSDKINNDINKLSSKIDIIKSFDKDMNDFILHVPTLYVKKAPKVFFGASDYAVGACRAKTGDYIKRYDVITGLWLGTSSPACESLDSIASLRPTVPCRQDTYMEKLESYQAVKLDKTASLALAAEKAKASHDNSAKNTTRGSKGKNQSKRDRRLARLL
jgi:hypothetical protein